MANKSLTSEQHWHITLIISWTMVAAVFGYGAIAYHFCASAGAAATEATEIGPLAEILLVVAVFTALVPYYIPRIILKQDAFWVSEQSILAGLQTIKIIQLAIAESIAIYGLVLSILTRDIGHFQFFGLICLCALVMYFPRRTFWKSILDEQRVRAYKSGSVQKG